MPIHKILVVDDEPIIRSFLKDTLLKKNFEVDSAENGEVAISMLNKNYDLIITDLKMPKKNGIEVLKEAKKMDPNIIVIIITAFGTIENAVEAIKLGAFNYLIKPFAPESIEILIEKAKENIKIEKENQYLRKKLETEIIIKSPLMQTIFQQIKKVAKTDASIFITGESGTGKEVVAKYIHQFSYRSKKPFIKVNCAAISETLIESEFFGHEKGAFTGADYKKLGRFELADKGTLLLDEVTEIPMRLQPKLLRAIQEREFERVGGIFPINVNIRIISTSNRDMKKAVDKKIFRQDLFYRLNVIPIKIPALRERKEDIIPLAMYFLKLFSKKTISKEAEKKLLDYHWPGNVRELANVIQRACILDTKEIIEKEHFYLESIKEDDNNKNSLYEIEKKFILKILKEQNFNKTKTAKILKISIKTLRNKLNQYEKISF